MLLESNIIIYAGRPAHIALAEWVRPITPPILERAVQLRQQRKMGLGDAIIEATALEHDRTLATRNVDDFRWIAGLTVLNPFDDLPPSP